ncbi:hypothetical protein BC835DRAFT_1418753 [Cytidiella melzeri]|nr:hypothetical protein BC835DRAFT_1418753 [Cytidiella melzeri]
MPTEKPLETAQSATDGHLPPPIAQPEATTSSRTTSPLPTPLSTLRRVQLAVFLCTFLSFLFACLFATVVIMISCTAVLVGFLLVNAVTQIPFIEYTHNLFITPFLPLAWAFLRTAAVGAIVSGGITGLLCGFGGAVYYIVTKGVRKSSNNGGSPDIITAQLKIKQIRPLRRSLLTQLCYSIALPNLTMSFGIRMLAAWAPGSSDEVTQDPLRAAVVTFVGAVVTNGVWLFLKLKQRKKLAGGVQAREPEEGLAVVEADKPLVDSAASVEFQV